MIVLRADEPWPTELVKNPATGVPEEVPKSLLELVRRAHMDMLYRNNPKDIGPLWLLLGDRGQEAIRILMKDWRSSLRYPSKSQTAALYGMKVLYIGTDVVEIVREWGQ